MEHFISLGLSATASRLAFDERVVAAVDLLKRCVDVSFIGNLSPPHPERTLLIEFLAERTRLGIQGNGLYRFPQTSAVHRRYRGEAWGVDMFRALGRSRVTVNCHIGIAGAYANKMRMFEATGMGTLAITDRKANLAELIEAGREVECYDTREECVAIAEHYRANEA